MQKNNCIVFTDKHRNIIINDQNDPEAGVEKNGIHGNSEIKGVKITGV